MQDAWRAYLELALGLTETSRKKAQQVVMRLLGQGGATAAQLQALAEELISTSAANRESLAKLVRFEVDRALGRLGLATAEEVADLTARVRELERNLRGAQAPHAAASAPAAPDAGSSVGEAALASALADVTDTPASTPAVPKTHETKAVPKKAAATKAVAERTVTTKAVTVRPVAKKVVAKKAVAKKAIAKKAVAGEPTGKPESDHE